LLSPLLLERDQPSGVITVASQHSPDGWLLTRQTDNIRLCGQGPELVVRRGTVGVLNVEWPRLKVGHDCACHQQN